MQEIVAEKPIDAVIAAMWRHPHEVDTGSIRVIHLLEAEPVASRALRQLPSIAFAFFRLLSQLRSAYGHRLELLLGHYSTYLLAWFAPALPRICFNQDMEWLFVRKGWRRSILKKVILLTNRRSRVVTTNAYVTKTYEAAGVQPLGEASIWAEARWLRPAASNRDIDVVMLVRGSAIKRLDLYLKALRLFSRTSLRVAVITPDTAIAERLRLDAVETYLRPSDAEMQVIFGRSRVFLLLSDVEGFGLPPLEAMGSGCVPVCRDAGGVRCYMRGEFANLLFPLDTPIEHIVGTVVDRLQRNDLPDAEAARSAFATGLQASRVSRADCIRRLQSSIGNAAASEAAHQLDAL
ncbi:glycosyltransferase [Terriglobus sp.]|uniref:glycosyltransferase n=1 Tax=Terriglobus sp. TaxID=1889013 RepID=UPI003AFFE950